MTKADTLSIAVMFTLIAAGGVFFYFDLQTDWYKTREFCMPRGYKSGFIRKPGEYGCVDRFGRHLLKQDILSEERLFMK
jgi:hypothetical protein